MTEGQWLNCADPALMLEFLRGKVSDRKLRLFAVACCRRVWDRMADERTRSLVLAAEGFADGATNADELRAAFDRARAADEDIYYKGGDQYTSTAVLGLNVEINAPLVTANVLSTITLTGDAELFGVAGDEAKFNELLADREVNERRSQSRLLHDIVGNPFRPVTTKPAWLTTDVVALAEGIYQERDFGAMPILADALQDAGCNDPDVLTHCRHTSLTHVRGCWVIDLLSGRK